MLFIFLTSLISYFSVTHSVSFSHLPAPCSLHPAPCTLKPASACQGHSARPLRFFCNIFRKPLLLQNSCILHDSKSCFILMAPRSHGPSQMKGLHICPWPNPEMCFFLFKFKVLDVFLVALIYFRTTFLLLPTLHAVPF